MKRLLFLSAATALLAGCSSETDADAGSSPTVVPETIVNETPSREDAGPEDTGNAAAMSGAEGGEVALLPLQRDDGAVLTGELACSFAEAQGGQPLFLGSGIADVNEAPTAVIRTSGGVTRLTGTNAAGFAGMTRGGVFTGEDFTVSISRGGEIPDDTEATQHSATLELRPPSGGVTEYQGFWICGP